MAGVTLNVGIQMTRRFGSGAACIAVTLITLTGGAGIMIPAAANKGGGGMAIMAVQCCLQVSRISFCILTDSGDVIVTGLAIVSDAAMIENSTDKCRGVVACTTVLAGWDMMVAFANGKARSMTGRTVINDTGMSE